MTLDGQIYRYWIFCDPLTTHSNEMLITGLLATTKSINTVIFNTYVDLMVMQRSCSSFLVSVKRVSPAREEAMIPALDTSESVRVDLPWSTWAMTDIFRMFFFLSINSRISSTVKFTCRIKVSVYSMIISSPTHRDLCPPLHTVTSNVQVLPQHATWPPACLHNFTIGQELGIFTSWRYWTPITLKL